MQLKYDPVQAHSHKCEACGTVWAHDPRDLCESFCGTRPKNREQMLLAAILMEEFAKAYDDSHNCPSCGEEDQTLVQADPDPKKVTVIWTGREKRDARMEDFE